MKYLYSFIALSIIICIAIGCNKDSVEDHMINTDEYLKEQDGCATIQHDSLYNSFGDLILTGFDEWGYNYQAHSFNGTYCDAFHNATWCQPWAADQLKMKWNDAWLSNKDCNGDGLLDRHYGYINYIGSGAWLTNHLSGTYTLEDGTVCEWTEFYKIIAVPEDAVLNNGYWYNADGTEIGEEIWGQFAIIQHVYNDPCAGYSGLQYVSPDQSGLGGW
jgi:hypothetical protein